jgi:hypothetical protein
VSRPRPLRLVATSGSALLLTSGVSHPSDADTDTRLRAKRTEKTAKELALEKIKKNSTCLSGGLLLAGNPQALQDRSSHLWSPTVERKKRKAQEAKERLERSSSFNSLFDGSDGRSLDDEQAQSDDVPDKAWTEESTSDSNTTDSQFEEGIDEDNTRVALPGESSGRHS